MRQLAAAGSREKSSFRVYGDGDAGAGDHHAGAETAVVALDIGDHVPFPIGGAEINGASGGRLLGLAVHGTAGDLLRPDAAIFRQQEPVVVDGHLSRVGDVVQSIGESHLHRFPLLVISIGTILFVELELLEDIQPNKGHQ